MPSMLSEAAPRSVTSRSAVSVSVATTTPEIVVALQVVLGLAVVVGLVVTVARKLDRPSPIPLVVAGTTRGHA